MWSSTCIKRSGPDQVRTGGVLPGQARQFGLRAGDLWEFRCGCWGARPELARLLSLTGWLRREKTAVRLAHSHNHRPLMYGTLAGRLARVPAIINTKHGAYRLLLYALPLPAGRCRIVSRVRGRPARSPPNWRAPRPAKTLVIPQRHRGGALSPAGSTRAHARRAWALSGRGSGCWAW